MLAIHSNYLASVKIDTLLGIGGNMFSKKLFLTFLLVSVIAALTLPKSALAFGCTSSTGYNIPVNVTLTKSTDSIFLVEMGNYVTCSGYYGSEYNDALRTRSVGLSISSALTNLDYKGFITVAGRQYNAPSSYV